MKHFYFYRLYQHNKKIFFGVFLFSLATVICNLKGEEITPFFVWGMYSAKEYSPEFYEIQEIVVDDSIFVDISARYSHSTLFFLNSPLSYYLNIQKNGGIDPLIPFFRNKLKEKYSFIEPYQSEIFNDSVRISGFLPWYKRYIESIAGVRIKNLKILNVKVHYSTEQKIVHDSTYIVAKLN